VRLRFVVLPWNAIAVRVFPRSTGSRFTRQACVSRPRQSRSSATDASAPVPLLATLALATFVRRATAFRAQRARRAHRGRPLGSPIFWQSRLAIDIGGWTWRPLANLFGELSGVIRVSVYGAAALAGCVADVLLRGLALARLVERGCIVRERHRRVDSRSSRCSLSLIRFPGCSSARCRSRDGHLSLTALTENL
jgi:hypothetical protein